MSFVPAERLAAPLKRGDLVMVWGRLARVIKPQPIDGRIELAYVDGDDPPAGYQACWRVEDIMPLPPVELLERLLEEL